MRTTSLKLASALLVAPMLAFAQAQPATPPGGGPTTTPTTPQAVTPGTTPPPAVGTAPGMTPGGRVGETPNPTPTQVDRPGAMMGSPADRGAAANREVFPAGSAVMARPRMSEIIGANVYNHENNSIGSVDDIILVPPSGSGAQGPLAIVQVGGFLGLGGRLVSVPLAELQWNAENERMVLPGATRDSLRERPEFRYETLRATTR